MYARVTRMEIPLGSIEEDLAATGRISSMVAETPGQRGMYYMMDRATGRAMAITLWESEQAMRDSEDLAARTRGERETAAGARVLSMESYEVIVQPSA